MRTTLIVCNICCCPLFLEPPSHNARTLMTTLPVDAAMPYPYFHFLLGFLLLCTRCHTGGVQNCNPTLDTMYPCIDYREGECYDQLSLPLDSQDTSLWILVSPVSLHFSDVRFTT